MDQVYPSAKSAAQELGLLPGDALESGAIRFVFNHYARLEHSGRPYKRMENAFENSLDHVSMRLTLMDNYEAAFFKPGHPVNKDALTIAVLCSPLLDGNSRRADIDVSDLPERITDDTVRQARKIQDEAILIKAIADIDYKGLRADNDVYSREAYFLAHINLLERMQRVENSAPTYEELSGHLRYDLICASRYIDDRTMFGRILMDAVDSFETKVTEFLKQHCAAHLTIYGPSSPDLSPLP